MAWRVKKIEKVNKEFTLAEILQAIEDDGLPQANGVFWDAPKNYGYDRYSDEYGEEFTVGSACAIGQGALNLGVHYNDLLGALSTFKRVKGGLPLSQSIMHRNDGSKWSIGRIARHFRGRFEHLLNSKVILPVQYQVIKYDINDEVKELVNVAS